jgi:hypothetical protein
LFFVEGFSLLRVCLFKCQRIDISIKSTDTGLNGFASATRPNAGFASCYKNPVHAIPVAAAEGCVRLRSSRKTALQ